MCMYDMDAFTCGFNAGTQEAKKELSEEHRQKVEKGIADAKKRGVHLGRPPKVRPKEFSQVKTAWMHKEISSRVAAARLGIAQDTFLRWCRCDSDEEMRVEEALSVLREFRNKLVCDISTDTENTEKAIEAIGVVEKHITEQKQKRLYRMERAKAEIEKDEMEGSKNECGVFEPASDVPAT